MLQILKGYYHQFTSLSLRTSFYFQCHRRYFTPFINHLNTPKLLILALSPISSKNKHATPQTLLHSQMINIHQKILLNGLRKQRLLTSLIHGSSLQTKTFKKWYAEDEKKIVKCYMYINDLCLVTLSSWKKIAHISSFAISFIIFVLNLLFEWQIRYRGRRFR